MRVSPHCHAESPLTGSTLATLVKQAKTLGRTHFAYTDHGHLSSAFKAYNQTKKAGLKFIPGIEVYFKDTSCQLISGTSADRCKYFTTTIYAQDQDAYQELCKVVSSTDMPTIEIYEERQQLWRWVDLEHMAKFNVQIVLGGIHCLVGKAMLAGKADVSGQILTRLQNIFGSRLSVAMIAEPWTKKFNQVVQIHYVDGTKDSLLSSDTVSTDKARNIKVSDLLEAKHHNLIKSKSVGMMHSEINKEFTKVTLHKGFLPLPGGDAMLKVNKFLLAMARRMNINVLVSDYAYYAQKEDKIVQTMRLEGNDKLQPNFHMKTAPEVTDYLVSQLGMDMFSADKILTNNDEWAKKFDDFKLSYKWRLAEVEGSALQKAMAIVKANGQMKWDDPKYVARLKEELEVIHKNGIYDLMPYFLPIRDVLNHYVENGQLVGPGRGSAGGSLLCYLMGITELDPFDYDLPFQRFFSMVRIKSKKLPDIDVDLEDRELLVGKDGHSGYLYGRWGNKAAQISTRSTVRLKSAILDTNRYFKGKVEDSIASFSKGLPTPPQGVTDHQFIFGYEDTDENHIPGLIEVSEELKKYAQDRPQEWEIVSKATGLTRAYSKHASAFVISDVPISDVIPTKDGNITQYEAKEAEEAGLIKYDFLVVKQLKDIRVCMDLIKKRFGVTDMDVKHFPHNGEKTRIWKLPHDPEVYKAIWSGNTETMFQINTASMRPYVIDMLPRNIMDLATLLALVRPGPLDFVDDKTGRNMTEEYMMRRKGESESDIKEMADLLPATYGIITFQESLNKIARELAGMDAETAESLRENMAKKKIVELMKMKPAFIDGAIKKVSQHTAEKIWDQMVTFGRYGFSVIHAVEYALITYACMFLKYHYPLEWWAAILTNATEQEITSKFWPYVKDIVSPPDVNLSSDTMAVDYANGLIRSKMGIIRGLGEKTIDPIVKGRPYTDIQDFVNKGVAGPSLAHKLIHVGVLDSMFPPRTGLLEKLKMYEQAVQNASFADKVRKAQETGKKMRALQPKEGQIPEEYLNLHPLKDAAMKKSVLPSLLIDLYALGAKYSKVLNSFSDKPAVMSKNGYRTLLLNGDRLRRLDELEGSAVEEDIYIAATCFVLETKEFSYAKNTKRALKMSLDADGYVSEKVLWPEYDSGKLVYPSTLKKGAIATIFFRKKVGRKDLSVMDIVVET